jgi:cytochrome c biogenesis protein CcmG/thiol:disulfide interchange protein DsbE
VGSACSRNERDTATGQPPEVGSTAPDFSLKDLNGRRVNLSDYRGHVVIIDFWATWCPPCQATIPELVSIEDTYRKQGLVVLGISLDEGSDVERTLAAFSKDHRMNYSVLLGTDAVEDRYNIRSIPTLFLVGKTGKIKELYRGYTDNFRENISAEIDKLL